MILSICVPTYNRVDYLARCLASIDAATRNIRVPIEVYVSNNGSEDKTADLLNTWKFTNDFVTLKSYSQEENIGPLRNIYHIAENAAGKYLLWCSDDDLITNGVIEEAILFAEKGEIGFIRFALVVHDYVRKSLYLHMLNQTTSDNCSEEKFVKILELSHILTGTLVKKEICTSIEYPLRDNIYPMAQWCCKAFPSVSYCSSPFAVHTYGNEVFWGSDVNSDSTGKQGSQSANDLLNSLILVPEISRKLSLHLEIYRNFSNDTYKKALENLPFALRINVRDKIRIIFVRTLKNSALALIELVARHAFNRV